MLVLYLLYNLTLPSLLVFTLIININIYIIKQKYYYKFVFCVIKIHTFVTANNRSSDQNADDDATIHNCRSTISISTPFIMQFDAS